MELYYLKNNILLGSLMLAVLSGAARYRAMNAAMRLFWLLSCTLFLSEAVAYLTAIKYRQNVGVYAVSSIAVMLITCLYFNYSVMVFRKYRIGWIAGAISAAVGIYSNFFLQSINQFPSYFLHYEALLVISMAMFSLTQMLSTHEYFEAKYEPHFWACTILIFFWSTTYFNWTLIQYYTHRLQKHNTVIIFSMFIASVITNIGTAILFFSTAKMQRHVR